ncbi:hypothetical protein FEF26_01490 [Nesterenkonia salmonea]|uniref:Uncharacterized protein n=1 Tax=Nesterenkonia salmonea TaxID=1804987 RepID=A0A5R9BHW0_9MICC|nr:hypothetical protein [Nesterenkonia salmonea]TLQ00267.1 hypothetical protein FEF26_01490 [Nesterenkonia salmonea]
MPRPVLLGICFASGVILGVLGTVLQGNIWVIGGVGSGAVVPWGAAAALLILLLALLWAGTTGRSLVEPFVMGGTAFTVATIAYLWPGPDQLVVPYSPLAMETLPGPVIASLVWWLGAGAVTLISMILSSWILSKDR